MEKRARRTRARRSAGGFTPVEEMLMVAATLACFVYPLSLAMRTVGQSLAAQMDAATDTLLTQAP